MVEPTYIHTCLTIIHVVLEPHYLEADLVKCPAIWNSNHLSLDMLCQSCTISHVEPCYLKLLFICSEITGFNCTLGLPSPLWAGLEIKARKLSKCK